MDFAMSKLLLAGVVALVVLGPKKLPLAARKAGRLIRRAMDLRDQLMSEAVKAHEPFSKAAAEFGEGARAAAKAFEWESSHLIGSPLGAHAGFAKYRYKRLGIQAKARAAKSAVAKLRPNVKRAATARMRPCQKQG